MKLLKKLAVSTALVTSVFCAADSHVLRVSQEKEIPLVLPHREMSADESSRTLFIEQGGYSVLDSKSAHNSLLTYGCRPCIALVAKAREAVKYPILMAHMDLQTDHEHLLRTVHALGIPSDQLRLTFFTNIYPEWNDPSEKLDGKSYRELLGKSQEEYMNYISGIYRDFLKCSSIKLILSPNYFYADVKEHLKVNETIVVNKTGEIFCVSLLLNNFFNLDEMIKSNLNYSLHDGESFLALKHSLFIAFSDKSRDIIDAKRQSLSRNVLKPLVYIEG